MARLRPEAYLSPEAAAREAAPPGVIPRAIAYLADILPLTAILGGAAYLLWPEFREAMHAGLSLDRTPEERLHFLDFRNLVRDSAGLLYLSYTFVAESWVGATLGKRVLGQRRMLHDLVAGTRVVRRTSL
jgi:uncharacterized RDD family membrane protein YckC